MLENILLNNQMPSEGAEEIERSCPEKLFFLEEDFIRRYYPIARLPEAQLDTVLSQARAFNADKSIRLLVWYMYKKFTCNHVGTFKAFPEFIQGLGYASGILYLLVLLSIIPEYEKRAERENFPIRYAHDAASRIGTLPVYFSQAFNGRFGIRARSMHFMLNFKDNPMYRIGRFDFILEQLSDRFPQVYHRGKEVLIFCADKWRLDKSGERLSDSAPPQPEEILTAFSDDGKVIKGYPVDIQKGLARRQMETVSRKEYQKTVSAGEWALHVHIPAGGKMTPEACQSSCREALAFFAEKYPEKPIKLIYTVSWIANPAWLDYIPNSNMAALIRSSALFPSPHAGNAGLYFVFGREDDDYASYPRTNSLERAMLDCIADGRPLRSTGLIFLP